jgi:flavin reductase (DIM6/NTAB) family NADH-FMN oxidoreductase RutF
MRAETYGMAEAAPVSPDDYKLAMRQLASGVSVITHGSGAQRTGFTATSVTSLSSEPPTLIVCVNRAASLYAQLGTGDLFGVNVLGAQHAEIADRFAGRAGLAGAERFREGRWSTFADGASLLDDALAAFVCETDEVIERHTHAILIGRVRLARPQAQGGALLYWRGVYDQIGWSDEEVSRAVGLRQRA